MRFYNIDMKGKFFVQRGAALPSADPSNEGRLFYNETNKTMYLHDDTTWQSIASTGSAAPYLRKDMADGTPYNLSAAKFSGYGAGTGVILESSEAGDYIQIDTALDGFSFYANNIQRMNVNNAGNLQIDGALTVSGATGTINGGTIWHSGNDGPGSGLNADLLDGQHGSFYTDAGNLSTGTLPTGRLTGTYNISITGTARYA